MSIFWGHFTRFGVISYTRVNKEPGFITCIGTAWGLWKEKVVWYTKHVLIFYKIKTLLHFSFLWFRILAILFVRSLQFYGCHIVILVLFTFWEGNCRCMVQRELFQHACHFTPIIDSLSHLMYMLEGGWKIIYKIFVADIISFECSCLYVILSSVVYIILQDPMWLTGC